MTPRGRHIEILRPRERESVHVLAAAVDGDENVAVLGGSQPDHWPTRVRPAGGIDMRPEPDQVPRRDVSHDAPLACCPVHRARLLCVAHYYFEECVDKWLPTPTTSSSLRWPGCGSPPWAPLHLPALLPSCRRLARGRPVHPRLAGAGPRTRRSRRCASHQSNYPTRRFQTEDAATAVGGLAGVERPRTSWPSTVAARSRPSPRSSAPRRSPCTTGSPRPQIGGPHLRVGVHRDHRRHEALPPDRSQVRAGEGVEQTFENRRSRRCRCGSRSSAPTSATRGTTSPTTRRSCPSPDLQRPSLRRHSPPPPSRGRAVMRRRDGSPGRAIRFAQARWVGRTGVVSRPPRRRDLSPVRLIRSAHRPQPDRTEDA